MNTYYIYKGTRKVDSFYLNELPIKFVHHLKATKTEIKLIESKSITVDDFGFFRRITPSQMFPIRKNSCIFFNSLDSANEYIHKAIVSITYDDRFTFFEKEFLIKYLQSFTVSF